jgi:hypothetical protein
MIEHNFGDAEGAEPQDVLIVTLTLLLRPSTTPLANCFLFLK